MFGKAVCPSSCGEIVQGSIDDRDFLVTCPIALYTEVSVLLSDKTYKLTDEHKISETDISKTVKAVEKTLKYFGASDFKAKISITSEIPRGIGLSSSTADITAACLATAEALRKVISADTISNIALSIEPSDGIMYPGAILFNHLHGQWKRTLGSLPEMDVYIIDTGEQIDTWQFNKSNNLKLQNRRKEPAIRHALEQLFKAFELDDIKYLGDAMITSAVAHQSILFKPHLPDIIELSKKNDSIGVNIAHSGSAIGIFFKKGHAISQDFWSNLQEIMCNYGFTYKVLKTYIDNNGPRVII